MNWKKTGLTIGICVALLAAGGYGVYQYVIHRYANQIDEIVSSLIDDSVAPETTPSPAAVEPQENPAPNAKPDQSKPTGATTVPDTKPTAEPPSDPTSGNSAQTGAIAQATEGLNLTGQEQAKAESATDLLEQMSTTEKLMVLKTLNRFSTTELLEMYRIYSQGDPVAVAEVKAKIKAQFSEADIELIKQMAAKYR